MKLPPEELRHRVGFQIEDEDFLSIGRKCTDSILAALPECIYETALDYGCGCGRMLRHFLVAEKLHDVQWFACDPDKEAVRWLADNAPEATVFVSEPRGCLPLPDASLDLVVAVSIFSHLAEWSQPMMELRRVLRPYGVLAFSFLGKHCYNERKLPNPYNDLTEPYFEETPIPANADFGRFYPNAGWAVKETARFFPCVRHIPQGLAGFQDLVIAGRCLFC